MDKYPKTVNHWINDTITKSSRTFAKYDPTTGKILARVARGGVKEAGEAVRAAQRALTGWREANVVERAKLLRRTAEILERDKIVLGSLLARELGKDEKGGQGVIGGAIEHALYWAGEGARFFGRTLTSRVAHRLTYTLRLPIGVGVVIAPANSPFGSRSVFPALVAGNAVIVKPSEHTPLPAVLFGQVLHEAGLPAGVYNVVQGYGEEAGWALVENEGVDLVCLTGSVEAGRDITERLAHRQTKFARLSLELGGKNALVVADDADLEKAVAASVDSAFVDSGQRCAAASRLIIFDSVYDQFRERFVATTKSLKLGPLISRLHWERVAKAVAAAPKQGAQILAGGDRAAGKGFYYPPTVLEGVRSDDPLSRTELFGPVAILYRVKNLREAIALTNDSPYGLVAAIFTNSLTRAHTFIEGVEVGVVNVNGPTFGSEQHMPFGGWKLSGNGAREGGQESLDVFTQLKTVSLRFTPEV